MGLILAILFLVFFGGFGYLLLAHLTSFAAWITQRGMYLSFLEQARTKTGRFQLRLLGGLMIFFSVCALLWLLTATGR